MEIDFTIEAMEHIEFYKKAGDTASIKKIKLLIESMKINPFEGLGKPEALKYELTGCWSRRINKENRIVYRLTEKSIEIIGLKGHYK